MVRHNEDNKWAKKCVEYEFESVNLRSRPKSLRKEIIEADMKSLKMIRRCFGLQ